MLSYEEAEVHNATLGSRLMSAGRFPLPMPIAMLPIPAAATTVTFLSPSKRMMKPNLQQRLNGREQTVIRSKMASSRTETVRLLRLRKLMGKSF